MINLRYSKIIVCTSLLLLLQGCGNDPAGSSYVLDKEKTLAGYPPEKRNSPKELLGLAMIEDLRIGFSKDQVVIEWVPFGTNRCNYKMDGKTVRLNNCTRESLQSALLKFDGDHLVLTAEKEDSIYLKRSGAFVDGSTNSTQGKASPQEQKKDATPKSTEVDGYRTLKFGMTVDAVAALPECASDSIEARKAKLVKEAEESVRYLASEKGAKFMEGSRKSENDWLLSESDSPAELYEVGHADRLRLSSRDPKSRELAEAELADFSKHQAKYAAAIELGCQFEVFGQKTLVTTTFNESGGLAAIRLHLGESSYEKDNAVLKSLDDKYLANNSPTPAQREGGNAMWVFANGQIHFRHNSKRIADIVGGQLTTRPVKLSNVIYVDKASASRYLKEAEKGKVQSKDL